MKTLDEVITELEDEGLFPDALYYLKEYKIKRERIMAKAQDCEDTEKRLQDEIARYQEAVKNCEIAENKYRRLEDELNGIRREHIKQMKNDPLTWDELRTMEGKPVWVESQRFGNHWYLNRGIKDESCLYFVGHYGENVLLYDDDMGTLWQAYRKERE